MPLVRYMKAANAALEQFGRTVQHAFMEITGCQKPDGESVVRPRLIGVVRDASLKHVLGGCRTAFSAHHESCSGV